MNKVEENNKKIAKFMDLPFVDGQYKNTYGVMSFFPELEYTRNSDELEFHSNWSWLMQVVEKIENTLQRRGLHLFDVEIRQLCVVIEGADIEVSYCDTKIEAVYEAVNLFIKWYSKN